MTSDITVIIPSTRKTFTAAVNSVLYQTIFVSEIIVIDDSVDQDLISGDPRVRILKTGGGKGVSSARNLGLKQATGNWIAFLDDDDIWLPKKLELQVAFMRSEKLDISFTNCIDLTRGVVRPNFNYSKDRSPLSQIYDTGIRLRSRYYLGFSSILINHRYKNSIKFNHSLSNREDLKVIQELWEFGARIGIMRTPLCVIFSNPIRSLGRHNLKLDVAWVKYLANISKRTAFRFVILVYLRNVTYLLLNKIVRIIR